MHLDVKEIRDFYYRSTLGRAARVSINKNLSSIWPETNGLNVMGFGFSIPFLRKYLDTSRRVVALMPAQMGVLAWPSQRQMYLCWLMKKDGPLIPDM